MFGEKSYKKFNTIFIKINLSRTDFEPKKLYEAKISTMIICCPSAAHILFASILNFFFLLMYFFST